MQKFKKILLLLTIITSSKNNGWFGQSLFEKGKSLWKDDTSRHIICGLVAAGAAATAKYVHKNYFTLEGIYNRKRNELYRAAINRKIQEINPYMSQEEKDKIKKNIDAELNKIEYDFSSPLINFVFTNLDGDYPTGPYNNLGGGHCFGGGHKGFRRIDKELFDKSKKKYGEKLKKAHAKHNQYAYNKVTLANNNELQENEVKSMTENLTKMYRLKAVEMLLNANKDPLELLKRLQETDKKGGDIISDRGEGGVFGMSIFPVVQKLVNKNFHPGFFIFRGLKDSDRDLLHHQQAHYDDMQEKLNSEKTKLENNNQLDNDQKRLLLGLLNKKQEFLDADKKIGIPI